MKQPKSILSALVLLTVGVFFAPACGNRTLPEELLGYGSQTRPGGTEIVRPPAESVIVPVESFACSSLEILCIDQCADPSSDDLNCGACGIACTESESCSQGKCTPSCERGLLSCDGICVDAQTDSKHCGGCEESFACEGAAFCDGHAECGAECAAALTQCNDVCVDLLSNQNNCGGCGEAFECNPGQVCDGLGVCRETCQPGLVNCDGSCIQPQTDHGFCGVNELCAPSSGAVCEPSEVCSNGSCVEQRAESGCQELLLQGITADGVYALKSGSAYCDMKAGGITYQELAFGQHDKTYDGYEVLTVEELKRPQVQEFFIWAFNRQAGLKNIDVGFSSLNCCLRDPNEDFTFGGSYLYPESPVGEVQCSGKYNEPLIGLARGLDNSSLAPPLAADFFSREPVQGVQLCPQASNPGLFVKRQGPLLTLAPGDTQTTISREGYRARCKAWQGRVCVEPWIAMVEDDIVAPTPHCVEDSEILRPLWGNQTDKEAEAWCWIASGNQSVVTVSLATSEKGPYGGWMFVHDGTLVCGLNRRTSEVEIPEVGRQRWSFDLFSSIRKGTFPEIECNWL